MHENHQVGKNSERTDINLNSCNYFSIETNKLYIKTY